MKTPKKPYVVTSAHGRRRARGRPPVLIMPDAIPDTPENIARAILTSPPKKDWDYLKPGSGARAVGERPEDDE